MSITDELRGWAKDNTLQDIVLTTYPPQHAVHGVLETLLRIADRIDAEHERLMQEQPFTVDMVPMTDERMAEHGWIRLPKDADGEYIHVGDVMEGTCPSGKHVSGEVLSIGDDKFWLCNVQFSLRPDYMHHHHAPTVEDLLREFVTEFNRDDSELCDEEIIEQFAAKLQLREDA